MNASPAVKDLSFEQALKELEAIVRALESGNAELDRALADYARGTELKDHCLQKLNDAKLKVEKLSVNAAGAATLEPFDTQQA